MSQPYVGEIRMFAGNFAIRGYAFCNGQLMSIAENDVLFALIGTTYGGDGQTTFGIPDLRGRIPLHWGTLSGTGQTFTISEKAGTETVTLTSQQLPVHNHPVSANTNPGSTGNPSNAYVAGTDGSINPYSQAATSNQLNAQSIGSSGGNQPHNNVMPSLCVNFLIALFGIFPPRN